MSATPETVYALKWLTADGLPAHGGSGAWSLPTLVDGIWQPGAWRKATGRTFALCGDGALHGCTLQETLTGGWFGPACWLMEMQRPVVVEDNKRGCRRARLVRPLTWDDRIARRYACDCAERVLPLFERERPDDQRPRETIAVARRFADGAATRDELAAAGAAAWAAAWAAAGAAAGDAVWAAAGAAAWAAAWDARAAAGAAAGAAVWAAAGAAAWAAAGDAARAAAEAAVWAAAEAAVWAAAEAAERQWQADRLAAVLGLTAEELGRMEVAG